MNLQTIDVDPNVARRAVADYRRAVRERHSKEDEQILKCYRAIVKGHRIINLHEAIRQGGVDADGRPKMAIARADAMSIRMHRLRDRLIMCSGSGRALHHRHPESQCPTFPSDILEGYPLPTLRVGARAVVPLIPPALRPAYALSNYHILFEADWKAVPIDPALLKHLGGPLYAVLAIWDLTPVEAAVLGMTRRG